DIATQATAPTTPFELTAANAPAGAFIRPDGTLDIFTDDALSSFISFTPQTTIPAEVAANTVDAGDIDGFLLIGDEILVAVEQLTPSQFKIKPGGVVGCLPVDGSAPKNGIIDGDLSPFFGSSSSVGSLFLPSSQTVSVRQVWLETGTVGEIFLKLMLSTGTA